MKTGKAAFGKTEHHDKKSQSVTSGTSNKSDQTNSVSSKQSASVTMSVPRTKAADIADRLTETAAEALDTGDVATASSVRSYYDLCHLVQQQDIQALLLLQMENVFLHCCVSDPRTGEGLYCELESFLEKLAVTAEDTSEHNCLDRLSRIAMFCQEAVSNILRNPHSAIRRNHSMVRVGLAREVDSTAMVWLSRLPGRTIQEKMAGRQSMLAVQRDWVLDTSENRLFKSFVRHLLTAFDYKHMAFGFDEIQMQELLTKIGTWLKSDDCADIRDWDNLPPNNLLLSDKNYHKIWMSWQWLKHIDNDTVMDYTRFRARLGEILFWTVAATLRNSGYVAFMSLPCSFSMYRHETRVIWSVALSDSSPAADIITTDDDTDSKAEEELCLYRLDGVVSLDNGTQYCLSLRLDSSTQKISIDCTSPGTSLAITFTDDLQVLIAKASNGSADNSLKGNDPEVLFSCDVYMCSDLAEVSQGLLSVMGFKAGADQTEVKPALPPVKRVVPPPQPKAAKEKSRASVPLDQAANILKQMMADNRTAADNTSGTVSDDAVELVAAVKETDKAAEGGVGSETKVNVNGAWSASGETESEAASVVAADDEAEAVVQSSVNDEQRKHADMSLTAASENGTEDAGDYCIVDLTSIRPCYRVSMQELKHTPNLFMMQFMQLKEHGRVVLDQGDAGALLLNSEAPLCPAGDIFFSERFNDTERSTALGRFLTRFRTLVPKQNCFYIVPEGINEFSLKAVYQQFKNSYHSALSIPRSIAAAISYQQHHAAEFAAYDKVILLVASLSGTRLMITPIRGMRDNKFKELFPIGGGWSWERYPAVEGIDLSTQQQIAGDIELYRDYLTLTLQDLFAVSEPLAFFEADPERAKAGAGTGASDREPAATAHTSKASIRNIAFNRIFYKAYNPQSRSQPQPPVLQVQSAQNSLTESEWKVEFLKPESCRQAGARLAQVALDHGRLEQIKAQVGLEHNCPILLLGADCPVPLINKKKGQDAGITSSGTVSSCDSLAVLRAYYQHSHSHYSPLWKEHLPELYMRVSVGGRLKLLPLIKSNSTIVPRYGETLELNSFRFELPVNGKKEYYFPLTQSVDGQKLRYELRVKDPSFPLSDPVACVWRMNYTYGAANSFSLELLPDLELEKNPPFEKIETEWIRSNEIRRESHRPVLPEIDLSWNRLFSVPGKDEKHGSTDVIKVASNFLSICAQWADYLEGKVQIMDFTWGNSLWCIVYCRDPAIIDGNRLYYCEHQFFMHQDGMTAVDFARQAAGDDDGISLLALFNQKHDNFVIKGAVPGRDYDNILLSWMSQSKDKVRFDEIEPYHTFVKQAAFAFRTIFENGRSLLEINDSELTPQKTEALMQLKEQLLSSGEVILRLQFLPEVRFFKGSVLQSMLYNCSSCGSCCPDEVWDYLELMDQQRGLSNSSNWIILGLALGERVNRRQLQWWQLVCRWAEEDKRALERALAVMAIDYVNNIHYFARHMSLADVEMLCAVLKRAFEEFVADKPDPQAANKDMKFLINRYSNIAQLVFVLLMARYSDDPKVLALVDSNNRFARYLAEQVELLIDRCADLHIELKQGIKFGELNKPDSRRNVPDLLYVCLMLLTGDDGSSDIKVSSIEITM